LTESHEKLLTGLFFVVMGVFILLAAFGLGPMSGSAIHAPRWVIGLAGLLFIGSGVLLIEKFHKLATFMAGFVTIGITVICAWIAVFGEAEYFSSGLSLFSDDTEVLIARVLFGAVAVLGAAITVNAFRKIFAGSDA
jgi:hypothetical protein